MREQGFRAHSNYEAVLGAVKSFAFGSCLFFVGTVLEWWLTHLNVKGTFLLLDNAVMGVTAGLMMLFYERHRQRELKKKEETIRLMNHHVRNALQVIYATSYSLNTEKDTRRVCEAVKRIEWALREVLPAEKADHVLLSTSGGKKAS
jgi:hypothetical protein